MREAARREAVDFQYFVTQSLRRAADLISVLLTPLIETSGKDSVRQYRLFFLNGGGHVAKAHEFEADDDAAAVRISEGWSQSCNMELWQGDRQVKCWDAAQPQD